MNRNPIIAYDARMIEHSGIGVRILNILNKLHLYKPSNFEIVLLGNPEILAKYNLDKYYKIIEYKAGIYSLKEMFGISEMRNFDLIDVPHFNVPLPYLKKTIATIHDIIPWKMKKFFPEVKKRLYMKFLFTLLRKYSKQIVSVSDFTKEDLVKEFRFDEKRILKIYNGIDYELFRKKTISEMNMFKKKYNLPKNYFLTVGIGKEHKNVEFIIQALKLKWEKSNLDLKLVIAGANGIVPKYLQEAIKGYEDYIIFLPRLEYSDLPKLYQAACLFIFPSLYEGFGLPVLEAQAMSCPVLSSNATVLPEILGNTAIFFDPIDQNDFLMKLDLATKKNPNLTELGLKNTNRFSWEQAAQRTIILYEDLLKVRNSNQ